MAQYPTGLPSAAIDSYSVDVSYGVYRTDFEHGNTRQRRTVTEKRHEFNMSMTLTMPELWQWQAWANAYGYDWHVMELLSPFSGFTGSVLIPHEIRYIGDISISLIGLDHVRVSVRAELNLESVPAEPIVPSGDWILGGTPSSPSSSNAIRGGIPSSPSTDFIISGTPAVPAA
jgi:hypothetical protein